MQRRGSIILTRAIIRVLAVVSAVVLLWVGALHLRPYEYPAGFDLIMPEPGCESHCILGIEPGVTSAEEAVARLETHPAVDSASVNASDWQITWRWQAAYAAHPHPAIGLNEIVIHEGQVAAIEIPLNMPLYEVRVRYGAPSDLRSAVNDHANVHVDEQYAGFAVGYWYQCTVNPDMGTQRPVNLRTEAYLPAFYSTTAMSLYGGELCE
ncbi:MAG: hypothetical protein AAFV33_03395 [Chloroflexota bacterium]